MHLRSLCLRGVQRPPPTIHGNNNRIGNANAPLPCPIRRGGVSTTRGKSPRRCPLCSLKATLTEAFSKKEKGDRLRWMRMPRSPHEDVMAIP